MVQNIRHVDGHVLIESRSVDRDGVTFIVKRCFDTVCAVMLLVLLAPLLALIALLVRLDSPGPVFFVQERVGSRRRVRHGQTTWEICTFPFLKFRTMYHGADQSLHIAHIKAFTQGTLTVAAEQGETFKLRGDPRVTRIGRFLRKTSLDELPQLVNVLRGEMSLVGPRPVPLYEAADYSLWHHERLAALPGITGFWQVRGRSQVAFEEMIRMDIDYVRNQSFWRDIKILLLTVGVVLSGFGAE